MALRRRSSLAESPRVLPLERRGFDAARVLGPRRMRTLPKKCRLHDLVTTRTVACSRLEVRRSPTRYRFAHPLSRVGWRGLPTRFEREPAHCLCCVTIGAGLMTPVGAADAFYGLYR